MLYFLIYAILVFISEFFINANLTNSLCGSVQWSTVVLGTGLPWIIMFGSLIIMLRMFPGWLAPFSNTFGYGIAKLAGLSNVLNNILALNPKVKGKQDTVIDEAIAHIYSDKSLLVNEITNRLKLLEETTTTIKELPGCPSWMFKKCEFAPNCQCDGTQ